MQAGQLPRAGTAKLPPAVDAHRRGGGQQLGTRRGARQGTTFALTQDNTSGAPHTARTPRRPEPTAEEQETMWRARKISSCELHRRPGQTIPAAMKEVAQVVSEELEPHFQTWNKRAEIDQWLSQSQHNKTIITALGQKAKLKNSDDSDDMSDVEDPALLGSTGDGRHLEGQPGDLYWFPKLLSAKLLALVDTMSAEEISDVLENAHQSMRDFIANEEDFAEPTDEETAIFFGTLDKAKDGLEERLRESDRKTTKSLAAFQASQDKIAKIMEQHDKRREKNLKDLASEEAKLTSVVSQAALEEKRHTVMQLSQKVLEIKAAEENGSGSKTPPELDQLRSQHEEKRQYLESMRRDMQKDDAHLQMLKNAHNFVVQQADHTVDKLPEELVLQTVEEIQGRVRMKLIPPMLETQEKEHTADPADARLLEMIEEKMKELMGQLEEVHAGIHSIREDPIVKDHDAEVFRRLGELPVLHKVPAAPEISSHTMVQVRTEVAKELVELHDQLAPLAAQLPQYHALLANAKGSLEAMAQQRQALIEHVQIQRSKVLGSVSQDSRDWAVQLLKELEAPRPEAVNAWNREEERICADVDILDERAEFAKEIIEEASKALDQLRTRLQAAQAVANNTKAELKSMPKHKGGHTTRLIHKLRATTVLAGIGLHSLVAARNAHAQELSGQPEPSHVGNSPQSLTQSALTNCWRSLTASFPKEVMSNSPQLSPQLSRLHSTISNQTADLSQTEQTPRHHDSARGSRVTIRTTKSPPRTPSPPPQRLVRKVTLHEVAFEAERVTLLKDCADIGQLAHEAAVQHHLQSEERLHQRMLRNQTNFKRLSLQRAVQRRLKAVKALKLPLSLPTQQLVSDAASAPPRASSDEGQGEARCEGRILERHPGSAVEDTVVPVPFRGIWMDEENGVFQGNRVEITATRWRLMDASLEAGRSCSVKIVSLKQLKLIQTHGDSIQRVFTLNMAANAFLTAECDGQTSQLQPSARDKRSQSISYVCTSSDSEEIGAETAGVPHVRTLGRKSKRYNTANATTLNTGRRQSSMLSPRNHVASRRASKSTPGNTSRRGSRAGSKRAPEVVVESEEGPDLEFTSGTLIRDLSTVQEEVWKDVANAVEAELSEGSGSDEEKGSNSPQHVDAPVPSLSIRDVEALQKNNVFAARECQELPFHTAAMQAAASISKLGAVPLRLLPGSQEEKQAVQNYLEQLLTERHSFLQHRMERGPSLHSSDAADYDSFGDTTGEEVAGIESKAFEEAYASLKQCIDDRIGLEETGWGPDPGDWRRRRSASSLVAEMIKQSWYATKIQKAHRRRMKRRQTVKG